MSTRQTARYVADNLAAALVAVPNTALARRRHELLNAADSLHLGTGALREQAAGAGGRDGLVGERAAP